jgi:hypothetical protein
LLVVMIGREAGAEGMLRKYCSPVAAAPQSRTEALLALDPADKLTWALALPGPAAVGL